MRRSLAPISVASAALRFVARRGRGDFTVLVVEPDSDVRDIANELAEAMASLGDEPVAQITGAHDADALVMQIATSSGPLVVSGLDGWPPSEWAHLDRLRSRVARQERTALVLGSEAFANIMREAPNFSSFLGASVMRCVDESPMLTADERERRLSVLRAWARKTDDEVVALAETHALPAEPEYAEWLVLLGRGDLIGR